MSDNNKKNDDVPSDGLDDLDDFLSSDDVLDGIGDDGEEKEDSDIDIDDIDIDYNEDDDGDGGDEVDDESEDKEEVAVDDDDGEEEEETHVTDASQISSEVPVSIQKVPMDIVVEIAKVKMSAKKIVGLSPGNIIDLKVKPEDSVSLTVNGVCVGKGELVRIGETIGVRVMEIA